MSLADELAHLDPETRERVRALFEIDPDGPGWDDELEYPPGYAEPIDGPHPCRLEEFEEGSR